MLHLKRASAGSGKTYQLARYFIRYLISIKDEDSGEERLRKFPEINDALSGILAVTFTNKATEEMKTRIVDRLYALAHYDGTGKRPDYLEEFAAEFHTTETKVSAVCGEALRVLLKNYSDFNVSTIDSFFQRVLRTFAYEADFADNYQVELDSGYVSRIGIDMMLDEVDDPADAGNGETARFWIRTLMNMEQGTNWNIFQKKESTMGSSVYGNLLNSFRRIDNEEFREHRDEIEEYLSKADNLRDLFETLESRYVGDVKALYFELQRDAEAVRSLFPADLWNTSGNSIMGRLQAQVKKIMKLRPLSEPANTTAARPLEIPKTFVAKAEKAWSDGRWNDRLNVYERCLESYKAWLAMITRRDVKLWLILRVSIPFLGLLKIVIENRNAYLRENNAVELGETSSLLSKIIGDDDTPFVYERMGTRLDHLLIDEFQDTSRMQWENVRPLITETLGRGNDNLIIGDAKQSIYRFRNAEPKLISRIVPEQYAGNIELGDGEMGTNFRSDYNIVKWNNHLFPFIIDNLALRMGEREAEFRGIFGKLYESVVQQARYKEGGYVRVCLKENSSKGTGDNEDEDEIMSPVEETIGIIQNALDRGYEMKDIAVLVRSNDKGNEIVDAIRNYNSRLASTDRKIEFVSEESLLIGKSEAVTQVVTVLESIARGSNPELSPNKVTGRKSGNIHELELSLLLFRREHPEMSAAESAEAFLDSEPSGKLIEDMLAEMQTLALPALVEATIARFVDTDTRRHDAPFLAAFQDCVLEYCDAHPSDLPSFIEWWKRTGGHRAISSPEGVDAVQIMTIHKSKGLERGIVIIPEILTSKVELGDYTAGRDWIWASMESPEITDMFGDVRLPARIPIQVNRDLEGTPFAYKLHEAYNLETMDNLNLVYVGMTRAVHELYVFAPRKKSKPGSSVAIGTLIEDFAESEGSWVRKKEVNGGIVIEAGEMPASKPHRDGGVTNQEEAMTLEDYPAFDTPDCIRCRESNLPLYSDPDEPDSDENDDPRSIGNICHAIMEHVVVEDDLPKAIRRSRALGLTGRGNVEMEGRLIKAMISGGVDVKRWFGGTAERVITERPVLRAGLGLRRPDRIMIFPGGKVEIVDYKFGKIDKTGRHSRQVRNYVEYLKSTGRYREVTGWLWYVFEDKIELVRK